MTLIRPSDLPAAGPLPSAADTSGLHAALALCAVALPMLWVRSFSPTSTFVNQWLAFAGMAAWLAVWAGGRGGAQDAAAAGTGRWWPGPASLGLLGLLLALALAQGLGDAPVGQRLIPIASLGLACVVALAGAWSMQPAGRPRLAGGALDDGLWSGLLLALLVAGLASVLVAAVQVFTPAGANGVWIALPTTPGRAIGNMRQPNQLSTLLLWAAAAAVWLALRQGWAVRRLAVVLAALVLAVVWTASRTGSVGVLLLVLWGVVDRRLPARVRAVLIALGPFYLLGWWGMEQWAAHTGHVFFGDAQVQKTLHGDPSSSRGRIWANTLALIAQHPWTGVGPGAYNFVWSMTPFPDRPVAFFDHSHNLPMQWAVESGLPFATGALGLVAWIVWRSRSAFTQADPLRATAARCAGFMLLLVGVHSLLEYPLWYTYFLLPTALIAGVLTGLVPAGPVGRTAAADASAYPAMPADAADPVVSADPPTWPRLLCLGVASAAMLGAGWAAREFYTVAVIFEPELAAGPPTSLQQRITVGQRSLLFGHHADYALVTMAPQPEAVFDAFDRPLHHLLDTRLMMSYARALEGRGEHARALHVAARLREFRNPASDGFFAPCAGAASAAPVAGSAASAGVPAAAPAVTTAVTTAAAGSAPAFPCGPDPKLGAAELEP